MTDILVEQTGGDTASRSMQITVPADRVQEAEARVLRTYSRKARLPGFRPGKAPDQVVRKRFNDAIRQSVLEQVIRESWEAAQSRESLKPVADPSIRRLEFPEGGPITFELVVEVRPELKLERTSGFVLTRSVPAVTDAQVQEQLHEVREQKAAWLPVEGTRPAPGQLVHVDVAPIEGDTVHAAQPYNLVLGDGQALPALEEAIMSILPGETREAEVKFPDDHPDPERRGKSRRVQITLREVKRKELPELDDAFAASVGDFATLADLTAAIRSDLQLEASRTADAAVRQQLIERIAEANNVPAPPSMVHRFLHTLAHAYQIPEDRLEAFEGEFKAVAEAQVRRDLILGAVAEASRLSATEGDLDARIQQLAEKRGVPPAQMYASLEKANRLKELERSITEEKLFAHLLSQSTVNEAAS